jgi:hypothetical protein
VIDQAVTELAVGENPAIAIDCGELGGNRVVRERSAAHHH